jgi:hypothetical protein
MRFFKTGHEERTRVHRVVQAQKKAYQERLAVKAKLEAEEKERRAMEEADFDFIEEEFDAALTKVIHLCMVADARTLGPAGLKIFETATLTPKEFREALKRTFNVRVTGSELGALVTLFDTSISGVVSTHSFLSCLVLVRAKLGPYKGKPDEKKMVEKQHSTIKGEYMRRVQRQMMGEDDAKPWQSAKPNKPDKKGMSKKPYPKTAAQKLSRRLKYGKSTGRLDLAQKHCWAGPKAKHREVLMAKYAKEHPVKIMQDDDGQRIGADGHRISKEQLAQEKYIEYLQECIYCFSMDHVGTIEWPASSEHQDELVRMENGIERVSIEFRLCRIPDDVFFMPSLREVWLDNNMISVVPDEIANLTQLRILSIAKNNIEVLPESVCTLQYLKRLSLAGNKLTRLPESFTKLRKLKDLDISKNAFEAFPACLLPIVGLESLNLSNNKLTSLPAEMKPMRALIVLQIDNNLFTEPPQVLEEMSWLKVHADFTVPTGNKACMPLTVSHEEELEFDTFLKNKSKARAIKAKAAEKAAALAAKQ